MVKVGIVGGAGYTAGELLRLLLSHPEVEIAFVLSQSQAGKPLHSVHDDLIEQTDIHFTDQLGEAEVLFLCLGHGKSREWLVNNPLPSEIKIIDLSQDFRWKSESTFWDWQFVYGLPELNREAIQQAQHIANPGCFATAIQLALLPLAAGNYLQDEVHIHAITGSTGAGQAPSSTTHFSWRNNNVSHYKAFRHQHLVEIRESLTQLQSDFFQPLNFVPIRGNFARGIFATAYINSDLSETKAQEIYQDFYKDAAFTKVSDSPIHLKQVVNTNRCLLNVEKHENKLLVTSIIDNLLKGASGQAVQNLNLMYGWEETMGLQLKPSFF